MGSLFPKISELIKTNGPMSVSSFMSFILTNKTNGYYMRQDVFGPKGDFTTAPEISQLFGEMIAVNFISKLERDDRPLHIIELGPGRGTLMSDMLRAFSSFPQWAKNLKSCTMVEVSPVLKQIQREKLKPWDRMVHFNWVSDVLEIKTNPSEAIMLVAQEFFDALPVFVFKRRGQMWSELKVAFSKSSQSLCLIEENSELPSQLRLNQNFPTYPEEQTLELSPLSWKICHQIKSILDQCSRGEGLVVDYGHFRPSSNSLRAIHRHQFCSIFENLGDADLSADVDFQSIMHYLGNENKYRFSTQGEFLSVMGINARLGQILSTAGCSASKKEALSSEIQRLTDFSQMGKIYKILEFSR